MNFYRIAAVIEKETLEIIRDPMTVGISLLMPLIMLFLFGYAISLDVEGVATGVLDLDKSPASRALVDRVSENDYFDLTQWYVSINEIEDDLETGRIKMGLVIPEEFQELIGRGETVPVQALVDGTYSATAVLVVNYARASLGSFNQTKPPLIHVETRVWHNPQLRSVNYVVPGLFGVILMAFPPLLTALAITREKETGTVQQIFASPLTSAEFLLGKLIPYSIIAFVQIMLVISVGFIWFDVPLRGSLSLLLATGFVYVFCTVSIGLLVSTMARSQLVAMLMALIMTLMPSFLFSGFLFPVFTMPYVLQLYARLFPSEYFIDLSRGIVLRGATLPELWPSVLLLFVYGAVIFALAVWRFRKKVA